MFHFNMKMFVPFAFVSSVLKLLIFLVSFGYFEVMLSLRRDLNQRRAAALLRLDPGGLDHFGEKGRLGTDQFTELLGRARHRVDPRRRELLLQIGR